MDLEALRRANPAYFDFLVQWQSIMLYVMFGVVALGVIVWLLFRIKAGSQKTLKAKYDYISVHEIKQLRNMHIVFAVALFLFINILEFETVAVDVIWFLVRLAIGLLVGILYGYVAHLLLKYYWPKRVNKRMRILRYTPRINPSNGNRMKLLSEDEEDAYLDEGMQAEEDVFSVDYDVWIDEETKETHIEKYDGRLSAEECDRCGLQTLKLEKELIEKRPTEFEEGILVKEFKCGYCGRIKKRTVKLTRSMEKDLSNAQLIDNPLEREERVVLVKVDIKSTQYNRLSYEFINLKEALRSEGLSGEGYGIEEVKVEIFTIDNEQLKFQFENLEEARNFLKQFDVHKVNE